MLMCYRCLKVGKPKKKFDKGLWRQGCSYCGSFVFFSKVGV